MRLLLLGLSVSILLTGCGSVNPLKFLGSGGPNVAANTQLGKTNNQTLGSSEVTEQKIVRPKARNIRQSNDSNKVQADQVETVVVNEYPIWLILAFVVAVLLDSPIRIFQELIYGQRKRP